MRSFDPSQRCCRRIECFEAEYWPCDSFNTVMVLLDDIIEISGLNDTHGLTSSGEFNDDV